MGFLLHLTFIVCTAAPLDWQQDGNIVRFEGEWIGDADQNAAAISQGILPSTDLKLKVSRNGDVVNIIRTAGTVVTSHVYRLNGQPLIVESEKRPTTTSLSWSGQTLVLVTKTGSRTETRGLTVNGDRLTVETRLANGRTVNVHYIRRETNGPTPAVSGFPRIGTPD